MNSKWALFAILALLMLASPARAEPLPVVATFSILGDMVRVVGGEHVQVKTLVGPDSDAHVYQPTPTDVQTLTNSRILFMNGLGFEGWMDRLASASGFKGRVVVVSQGIQPLAREEQHNRHEPGHRHDAVDPHAWHNLQNAMIYVQNMADALVAMDPAHEENYRQNAAAYREQLASLDQELHRRFDALPAAQRKVISSHNAFGYFGAAYQVTFLAPTGLSSDAEATARDVANLIRQIRATGVRALFVENISDPRLMQRMAQEAGATLGGVLYSDALSTAKGPASTYLEMFRFNALAILNAIHTPP